MGLGPILQVTYKVEHRKGRERLRFDGQLLSGAGKVLMSGSSYDCPWKTAHQAAAFCIDEPFWYMREHAASVESPVEVPTPRAPAVRNHVLRKKMLVVYLLEDEHKHLAGVAASKGLPASTYARLLLREHLTPS